MAVVKKQPFKIAASTDLFDSDYNFTFSGAIEINDEGQATVTDLEMDVYVVSAIYGNQNTHLTAPDISLEDWS